MLRFIHNTQLQRQQITTASTQENNSNMGSIILYEENNSKMDDWYNQNIVIIHKNIPSKSLKTFKRKVFCFILVLT